ncbi:MAG: 2-dehydropantoate 2-reductase [Gammaproteobacteria bacterium]|jgi:2-dehydropantoate 2-reductase
MKICVYGAGAVGSHFAARLSSIGEKVCVVARGAHLGAVREHGITVRSGEETLSERVDASDSGRDHGVQDLVIVTLKAPSLPHIVDDIKHLLSPTTPIIFAMNGILWWYFYGLDPRGEERQLDRLDPGGRWWREIGPERVIGGVVYSSNEIVEPGVVEHRSPGRNQLRIAEPNGEPSERAERVNEVLTRADMAVETHDIRATIWEKLLANMAYGPIACLTGSTITDIVGNSQLRALAETLMNEAIAIAASVGVDLGIDAKTRIAGTKASGHKVSLLQDLERGRAMEIDAITTVPHELGRAAGVPTPALDNVLALLKQRARLAGTYDG